jgi:hypothetical protein
MIAPTLTDAAVIAAIPQIPADDYPEELQAARRAAYVARVRERNSDPDAVDVETEPVSEWQDARNSRPEPY